MSDIHPAGAQPTGTPFAVAIELDGSPQSSVPHSGTRHDDLDIRVIADLARQAEDLGLTAVTFDDAPVSSRRRLDAVQRAAFVAPLTRSIGLIPVTRPGYTEPFHVATQLASLDWVSSGRAGWLAVSSPDHADDDAEARAFGREALAGTGLERERRDAIEVSRRLWDSWEDDAVIKDVATGRYLDADKLHYVDFTAETYSITGPLITPRPPQGQLVVLGHEGAGSDVDPGDRQAGIDIALVTAARADVAARAASARAAGAVRVWADLAVTEVSPELASRIVELSDHVDGVHLRLAGAAAHLAELGRHVLPVLRERIGFRSPRAGDTLRTTLGLERPANRYTRGAEAA